MKKMIFLMMLSVLALTNVLAQTMLSIEDAVDLAIKNNLSIERAKIDLNALKRKDRKSLNGLTPIISVGAGITSPNQKDAFDYTANANANIALNLGPAIFTNIKQAKLEYESGAITFEVSVRAVELATRKAFFLLLYEARFVEAQKRYLDTAQKQYEQAQAKYREGRVSELDVLQAQVMLENTKPAVISAVIMHEDNLQSFKQLIGLSLDTDITLTGSLEAIFTLRQIQFDAIQGKSLTIQSLEKSLETAKYANTAAKVNLFSPNLSFSWAYNPVADNHSINDTWKDSGQLMASISLSLDNFLPWSKAMETVNVAKDALDKINLQLQDEYINFEVKTSSYVRSIIQSQVLIESNRASVELAQKTYAMTQAAYNSGVKDLLALQSAADALLKAEVALLSEAYNLITNILDLENEINAPFGTLGNN